MRGPSSRKRGTGTLRRLREPVPLSSGGSGMKRLCLPGQVHSAGPDGGINEVGSCRTGTTRERPGTTPCPPGDGLPLERAPRHATHPPSSPSPSPCWPSRCPRRSRRSRADDAGSTAQVGLRDDQPPGERRRRQGHRPHRARGKAGYNGIVLADYKLNVLDRVMPDTSRTSRACRRRPARAESRSSRRSSRSATATACSLTTQSRRRVARRPCPVRGQGRRRRSCPDPAAQFKNGDLEDRRATNTFVGFGYPGRARQDDLRRPGSRHHGGKVSCRIRTSPAHPPTCRLIQ